MSDEKKDVMVADPRLPAEYRAEMLSNQESMFFNVALFEQAQRVSKIFAESTMVPEHFKNNIGNCMIALNYANRIKADPFMVLQNLYVVHGRPGVEGKLIIALINQSGKYSEPLKFRFDGTGEEYGCTAYTKEAKSGELVEGTKITAKLVKAEGWDKPKGQMTSKWVTMPDLMYRYRAASWFASTNCPELKLGMSTVEEINDFVDLTPNKNGKYEAPEKTEPAPIDTSRFDSLAKDKVYKPEKLAEFITLSAGIQSKTEPELKAMAQDHFEDFWQQFMKWQLKDRPAEGPKTENGKAEGKDRLELKGEVRPAAEVITCPNTDKWVTPDKCDKCKSRPGCPAWPTEEESAA